LSGPALQSDLIIRPALRWMLSDLIRENISERKVYDV